jgi:hypothetical protein
MRGVTDRMRELEGIEAYYHPNMYYAPLHTEVTDFMVNHAVENAFDKGNASIVAGNDLFTQRALAEREKRGEVDSMPIVALTNGNLEPELAQKLLSPDYKEQVDNIIRFVIPASDPVVPLEAIMQIKRSVKRILVMSFGEKNLKPLQDAADKLGITLNIVQSTDIGEVVAKGRELAVSVDAILYYEEHCHLPVADYAREFANKHKIPLIGGGIEFGPQGAVIAHGFDTKRIGRELVEIQRKLLHRKEPILKEKSLIIMDGIDQVVVNENMCKKQGVTLSKAMLLMLKNSALIGPERLSHKERVEEGKEATIMEVLNKQEGADVTLF